MSLNKSIDNLRGILGMIKKKSKNSVDINLNKEQVLVVDFIGEFEAFIRDKFGGSELSEEDKGKTTLELCSLSKNNISRSFYNYNVDDAPITYSFDLIYYICTNTLVIELESLDVVDRNKGKGTEFFDILNQWLFSRKTDFLVEMIIQPSGFGSYYFYIKNGFMIKFESESEYNVFTHLFAEKIQLSVEDYINVPLMFSEIDNFWAYDLFQNKGLVSGYLYKRFI